MEDLISVLVDNSERADEHGVDHCVHRHLVSNPSLPQRIPSQENDVSVSRLRESNLWGVCVIPDEAEDDGQVKR